jgi:N-carbamoyl-L-amino-acid hydrolase
VILTIWSIITGRETSMAQPAANLRINGDRLWDTLMEMAKIGPGIAGGNNRQTLTDEDAEGRALFQKWCEEAGCSMGLDAMGNMFARRIWIRSRRAVNMMGFWVFSAGWRSSAR